MKNLLLLALIGSYLLGGVIAFDFHQTCSEKITVLKDDAEITQLIKEQSLKNKNVQEILEGSGKSRSELSSGLLKCLEVLMKKGFFKVGHTFIDEILDPLEIGLDNFKEVIRMIHFFQNQVTSLRRWEI